MTEVSGSLMVFALGCGGGFAIEVLRWWKLREAKVLPEYAKSILYWGATIAMILLGGGLATLYGYQHQNVITAVHIGASAPAILAALMAPPGGASDPFSATRGEKKIRGLREFLTFRG